MGFSIFSSYPVLQFVGRQAIVLVLSWDTDPETGEPIELSRARHVTLTLGFVGSGILMAVVVRLVCKCVLWLKDLWWSRRRWHQLISDLWSR